MSDFIIRISEYTLGVYETNKAHALGFFKWRLWYTFDELPDHPQTIQSSGNRYMTLDQALLEVVDAFYSHAGSHRFTCLNCKSGEVHYVTSVDLNEDATQIVVHLRCHCGTDRTMDYPCKVIG